MEKRAKEIKAQIEEANIPAEGRSHETSRTSENTKDPINMFSPFEPVTSGRK